MTKIKKLVGILMLGGFVFCSGMNLVFAQMLPIDLIIGQVFQEIDGYYVEWLPNGHLNKNQQRYIKCNWKPIQTEHFEIFNCSGNKELSEFYAGSAEKYFKEFSESTGIFKFRGKLTVIVLDSQRGFEENKRLKS